MKTTHYTQCIFILKIGDQTKGWKQSVGYIPSWAAKVGNKVQLLEFGEDFWEIVHVGTPQPADEVNDRQKDAKRIRAKDSYRKHDGLKL